MIGLLQAMLVDGGGRIPRLAKFVGVAAGNPRAFLRSLSVRHWSERTVIALVMQTDDNSLELASRRSPFGRGVTSRQGPGNPPPEWIPVGHEAVRRLGDEIGGDAGGSLLDLVNIPMTAHFLGGCVIGDSPETGVVDPYLRAYGHEGIHVVDGSVVTANLGVNPSLTITAQAERAMALWPNKGEADSRPAVGTPYAAVKPVLPVRPTVPSDAPGALRLPLFAIRPEEAGNAVERA